MRKLSRRADRSDAGRRRSSQSGRQPATGAWAWMVGARVARSLGLAGRLGATRSLGAQGPTLGLPLVDLTDGRTITARTTGLLRRTLHPRQLSGLIL